MNTPIINLVDLVNDFVKQSFHDEITSIHLDRTGYWCKQLYPDSSETLILAAISHDIERSVVTEESKKIYCLPFTSDSFLKYHQEKGADIMFNFLINNGLDENSCNEVWRLISRHEIGGYLDENILQAADSISFFENNVDHFINKYSSKMPLKEVEEKFEWMYRRISRTLPIANELVEPLYKQAIVKARNLSRSQ